MQLVSVLHPLTKHSQIASYMVVCLLTRRAIVSRMLSCLLEGDVLQYLTVERAHLAKLNPGESSRDNHYEAEGNEITTLFLLLLFLADVSFTRGSGRREVSALALITLDQIEFGRLMVKCGEVCRSRQTNQSYLVDKNSKSSPTAGLIFESLILWIFVFFGASASGQQSPADQKQDITCCCKCRRTSGPSSVLCNSGPR